GVAAIGAPFSNRGRFQLFGESETEYSARRIKLVRETVVADMLGLPSPGPAGDKSLREPAAFTDADMPRVSDSGLTASRQAVGTGGPSVYESTFWFLSGFNGFIAAHTDAFMRIDSADDFAKAKAAKKLGLILGVQNSEHFRTLQDVDRFYSLGQRVSQLTYN